MKTTIKAIPNIKALPNIKKQGGWTFWSLCFTLGVIMFFSYVGMKLVPVYSEDASVKNAMKVSIRDQDLRKISRGKIIAAMRQQLDFDTVQGDIFDFKTDLKITRNQAKFVIEVDYDRTVPLFANIGIIADFNPKIECDLRGKCEY